MSLGSGKACAGHSGRDAPSTSLLFSVQTTTWFSPSQALQWALGCVCGTWLCSLPFPPPLGSNFLIANVSMCRSLRCLCIEQGILCWIIIVKTIVTPGAETRGASHTTMLLMSKLTNYLTGTRNLTRFIISFKNTSCVHVVTEKNKTHTFLILLCCKKL